jgi:hypothetical protein
MLEGTIMKSKYELHVNTSYENSRVRHLLFVLFVISIVVSLMIAVIYF